MRLITTALEHGAQLEDVQKARDIATPAPPSSMIGAATIPEKAASFLRRFDVVLSPELARLAVHHTIFWEIRA
jgi:hypothetical protein